MVNLEEDEPEVYILPKGGCTIDGASVWTPFRQDSLVLRVQKSVDFIKSNIDTANSISDIAGAIDGLFAGENKFNKSGLV